MVRSDEHREDGSGTSMPLLSHLDELRRRLIIAVIAFCAGTAVVGYFVSDLFSLLVAPLEAVRFRQGIETTALQDLGMEDIFVVYIKLALLGGLFMSSPVILWQVWRFIAPGLYAAERRWVVPFVLFGTLFFVCGGVAGYLALPYLFEFFLSFENEWVQHQWSVRLYFNRVLQMVLMCGLIFEQPLVMWILSAAGVLNPKTVGRFRPYWWVLALVLGAFFTPPDPGSQIAVALLMALFYELGIWGGYLLYPKRAT